MNVKKVLNLSTTKKVQHLNLAAQQTGGQKFLNVLKVKLNKRISETDNNNIKYSKKSIKWFQVAMLEKLFLLVNN